MQKLYCYVDESGQDVTSKFFVVVAVLVFAEDRMTLQDRLLTKEDAARTGRRKWNNLQHNRRLVYLRSLLDQSIGSKRVFFVRYKKPIPYFFPVIEILEKSINHMGGSSISARVYVDGTNKTIARALTNALRSRGISLTMIKGKRDENEPLIRLADMWAGCIRSALLHKFDAQEIFERAQKEDYLVEIKTQNPR